MLEGPNFVRELDRGRTQDLALARLVQRIEQWPDRVRELPVSPRLPRAVLVERVRAHDFSRPRDLASLVDEVADLLERGSLHATHPRYFGLFVPGVRPAGVVADGLAALYNAQLGAWWHGPAAAEIEQVTLHYLRRRIGFDTSAAAATFTTGGSEATLTAVLAALARALPRRGRAGLVGLRRPPVFYASDQAHDSLVKVAHVTGLGRAAFRRVRSDRRQRLDPDALRRAIARDRKAGSNPFLVVATVGTTATGAIDPLEDLAALCRAEGLWLHADAAWGGLALLSDTLRVHVRGLERADSVTWDAHKTLPVPMGAGMFFCRWPRFSEAAFEVHTGYVPEAEPGTADPYRKTLQWSRRFIGLKVFLTLAELGDVGITAMIDHQAAMGRLLREALLEGGWRVRNDSPLPLVCFTPRDAPKEAAAAIARSVAAEGAAWVSEVRLPAGERWLRACITHHETGPEDVGALVAAVGRARLRARRARPPSLPRATGRRLGQGPIGSAEGT